MFISLARQGLFLIPSLIILTNKYGLEGVWLAQPVTDMILAIFVVTMLVFNYREIKYEGIVQPSV